MEKNNTTPIIVGIVALLAIVGGIIWFTSRDNSEPVANETQTTETEQVEQQTSQNIVELASGNENLSTLVAAVKAANLVETLQGEGPFTVFAPTNDAFNKLPAGTLDTLLKPENVEQLKAILTYHVVAGEVKSSDLRDGQVVTTVQGGTLTVNVADGKVTLTDAKGNKSTVVTADVDASNGVVHVIDSVVLPQ